MEGYPESGWQRIVRERSRQAQVDPRQAARSGSVATARDKEAPLGAISPITRSWSTSEVERPIPVSSWDGRFRVPVKSVPDWIVVLRNVTATRQRGSPTRRAPAVRSTPPFGGYGRSVRPGGGPASSPPKRGARLEQLRPRTP